MSRLIGATPAPPEVGDLARNPTAHAPGIVEQEQRIVLHRIDWDLYERLSDAYAERRGPKMVFVDGRLALVSPSYQHDRAAVLLDFLITAVADGLDLDYDAAGRTTFRSRALGVGVEGDRTYYFGQNAERMRGAKAIDLTTQPPPDLAIEVEVSNPADDAMLVYGRLGVPEVWRFDAPRESVSIWNRRDDGTYARSDRSEFLPLLEPEDIIGQPRLGENLSLAQWRKQLAVWVRDVLLPRGGGGT